MSDDHKIDRLNGLSWVIIALAIMLVGLAIGTLLSNHHRVVDFVLTGPIADNVSEIAGPLIGISSVAMMFLAFYVQYRANKLVIRQFDYNQFEHRFFELFRMHKENSGDVINSFSIPRTSTDADATPGIRRRRGFEYFANMINREYEREKKTRESSPDTNRDILIRVWRANQDENFDQYYRHLFLLVRFVISREFLTYEQKRSYLRIVRASLSSHEQILLYYNWLSGDGRKWEDDYNHFLTDYRMIHNVDLRLIIPDFDVRTIQPFADLMKNEKYMKEMWRVDDPMFESEHKANADPPQSDLP
jgi:hypothetical protein